MEVGNTIGYKDVNPFYHHINWLLEQEALMKWKFNDLTPNSSLTTREQQLVHLEDWFMNLETLYHRIIGKLEDTEVTKMDALFTSVNDISKSDNFMTAGLSNENIITIRTNCRAISREINLLLWKHKIHVDVKSTKEYKGHGEEIDAENSQ